MDRKEPVDQASILPKKRFVTEIGRSEGLLLECENRASKIGRSLEPTEDQVASSVASSDHDRSLNGENALFWAGDETKVNETSDSVAALIPGSVATTHWNPEISSPKQSDHTPLFHTCFPLPVAASMRSYSSSVWSDLVVPPTATLLRSSTTLGTFLDGIIDENTETMDPPSLASFPSFGERSISRSMFTTPDNRFMVESLSDITNSNQRTYSSARETAFSLTSLQSFHGSSSFRKSDDSQAAALLLTLKPAVSDGQRSENTGGWHVSNIPIHSNKVVEGGSRKKPFFLKQARGDVQVDELQISDVPTLPRRGVFLKPSIRNALQEKGLLYNVATTDKACKCKTTHCLKLYCSCFQTKKFCDPAICKCGDCLNVEEENLMPEGQRARAIVSILSRRVDAFKVPLKKRTGAGCSCKKNRCLQKYCDCRAIGAECDAKCLCQGCANRRSESETDESPMEAEEAESVDAVNERYLIHEDPDSDNERVDLSAV